MSKTTLENLLDMLERSNSKKKTPEKAPEIQPPSPEPPSPESPGALTISVVNEKLEIFGQQLGALLASVQQLHEKVNGLGMWTNDRGTKLRDEDEPAPALAAHVVDYETEDTAPNEPEEPEEPEELDETDETDEPVSAPPVDPPLASPPISPSCRALAGHIQGRKSVCMLHSDALADLLLRDETASAPKPEADSELVPESSPAPAPAPASPVRATLEPTPELDAPVEDRATEIDTDTDTHATAVADAMNLEESYIIRIREEAELAEQTD
jgi:hypothetical protein